MSIKKSTSSIDVFGDILIDGNNFTVAGSFITLWKTFSVQATDLVPNTIYSRNFTRVELNGMLRTPLFIDGKIIFMTDSGKYYCGMELRRTAGKFS